MSDRSLHTPGVCQIPPPGWTCSREPGHDGPCAASPVEKDAGPIALVFGFVVAAMLTAFSAGVFGHLALIIFRWAWGLL